jgi:hypothetical protein
LFYKNNLECFQKYPPLCNKGKKKSEKSFCKTFSPPSSQTRATFTTNGNKLTVKGNFRESSAQKSSEKKIEQIALVCRQAQVYFKNTLRGTIAIFTPNLPIIFFYYYIMPHIMFLQPSFMKMRKRKYVVGISGALFFFHFLVCRHPVSLENKLCLFFSVIVVWAKESKFYFYRTF